MDNMHMVSKMKRKKYNYEAAYVQRPGVLQTPGGRLFAVEAAPASEVELLLYAPGAARPFQTIPMPAEGRLGALFAVLVDIPDDECPLYTFRIDGREITDPVATQIAAGGAVRGQKCPRAVAAATALSEERPLALPWTETVLYKLHVRGYTMGAASGARKKGTFQGLAEKLTDICDLGVTSVLLMPCYEPSPGNDTNYWGYCDGFYFAPRNCFCATEQPAQEFQELVRAMHAAGLECLLEFYFPAQMPARKVVDVLRHWSLAYGVDGFHLLGEGDWLAAAQQDPVLADRKLLCERAQAATYDNVAIYDRRYMYAMRRFLRGDRDLDIGEVSAWLCRNRDDGVFRVNFFADQDGFTMADMVTYEGKRNEANGQDNLDGTDYNLSWNCGLEGPTRRRDISELRFRQLANAFALLAFSQGIPLLYAGDERMNSQGGNNNAWCQDNATGWVTWNRNAKTQALQALVQQFLCIRREHPALRQKQPLRMTDHKSLGFPDVSFHNRSAWVNDAAPAREGLGIFFFGPYAQPADSSLYLACNMGEQDCALALPKAPGHLRWEVAADTTGKEIDWTISGDDASVVLPAHSVQLLVSTGDTAGPDPEKRGEKDK